MTEDEARRRHFQLTGIRVIAVVMVLLGVTIVSGRLIDEPLIGYALVVLGAAEFFALPWFLTRQWKKLDS
ncbi:hypothetical protein PF049_05240 [Erythrobacteraceae bacterium WH01K]|nr:hypothetical protein PF049_05240 [Erythrobacteraceae bacterium WH01K]